MNLERKQFMLRIRFIWSSYLGKLLVQKYYNGGGARRKLKKSVKKYEKKYNVPIFFEIKHDKTHVTWEFLTTNLDLLMETEEEMTNGVAKELERKMNKLKIDKVRSALNKFKGIKDVTKESIANTLKKDLSEKLGYFMDFEYSFDGTKIKPHNKVVYNALMNNKK